MLCYSDEYDELTISVRQERADYLTMEMLLTRQSSSVAIRLLKKGCR